MIALFLAGGSGTRLWPLSRENNPKQLQPLISDNSLMTQTIERITPIINPKDVWIITNKEYANRIADHCPGVPKEQIIAEPFALGTNLAVGLGAIHIARSQPNAVVVIGWADSYIGKEAEFRNALQKAEKLVPYVDGVILAVPPTHPATSYGYIEVGESLIECEGAFRIASFEEKPNSERALQFFNSKSHFWNSGISVWSVSRLLTLMQKYKPDHYAALQYVAEVIGTPEESSRMERALKGLDGAAIDHTIFEKATQMATIPVDLDWNDIGSWTAIYDVKSKQGSNVTRGLVVSVDTHKCLIYAEKRLIATLGISDLIIVETDDAILIAHKDETDRLKELYAQVKISGGVKYL
jgi:mannose-1-phosphate guanylyltransferase